MTPAAHSYEICGARNRQGAPCCRRPHPGKRRCWLHGGAPGSGAPKGNRNALKHGHFTAQQRALRRSLHEPNEVDRKLEELMSALPVDKKSGRKSLARKKNEASPRTAGPHKTAQSRQRSHLINLRRVRLQPLPSFYLSEEEERHIFEALHEHDLWHLRQEIARLEKRAAEPPETITYSDTIEFVEEDLKDCPRQLPKYLGQIDKNPDKLDIAIRLGELQFVTHGPVVAREVARHASRKTLRMLFDRVWKNPTETKAFELYILHEAADLQTGAATFFADVDYEALDARPELTEEERHLMLFDQALPADCF